MPLANDTITSILDIHVNYDEAVKRLNAYKQLLADVEKAQDQLKEQLDKGLISQQEYNEQIIALNTSMKNITQSYKDVEKWILKNLEVEKRQKDSINELRAKLAQLTQEYNALSGAERKGAEGKGIVKTMNDIKKALDLVDTAMKKSELNKMASGSLEKAHAKLKLLKEEYEKLSQTARKGARGSKILSGIVEESNRIEEATKAVKNAMLAEKAGTEGLNGSLKELRAQLQIARDQYENMTKAERDNKNVGGKVLENIQQLAQAIKTADHAMRQASSTNTNTSNTLQGLRAQLRDLKDKYVNLTEAERNNASGKAMAENIGKLTQKIKSADEAMRQAALHAKENALPSGSLAKLRAQLSQLTYQFDNMARAERNGAAGRALIEQINNITKEIKTAEEATMRFYRNVGNYESAFGGLKNLASGFSGIGNIIKNILGGFSADILVQNMMEIAKDFEDSMARVRAVANPTTLQLKMLTETAKELGRTTRYTAAEVADGMEELSRKGLNTNDTLLAIKPTLELAQANVVSVAEAAQVSSSTMRAFGFQAEDLAHINDVLSATCSHSATNISMLGEAMKTAGPVAATMISETRDANKVLNETVALIGGLANVGMTGSDAGTGVKQLITAIATANTSAKGKSVLAKYNLEVTEARIKTEGLIPILKEMKEAGLGENISDIKTLAGKYAAPRLAQMIKSIDEVVALNEVAQNSYGENARMFEQSLGTTTEKIALLKSAWQGFMIEVYDSTSGYITGPMDILKSFIEWLTREINFVSQLVGSFITAYALRPILVKFVTDVVSAYKTIKTQTVVTTSTVGSYWQNTLNIGKSIKIGFIKILSEVKKALMSIAPLLAITAAVEFLQILKNIYDRIHAVDRAIENIKSLAERAQANAAISQLEELKARLDEVHNKQNKTNEDIEREKKLINQANSLLGTTYKTYQDITGELDKQIARLKKAAIIQAYTNSIAQSYQKIMELSRKNGLDFTPGKDDYSDLVKELHNNIFGEFTGDKASLFNYGGVEKRIWKNIVSAIKGGTDIDDLNDLKTAVEEFDYVRKLITEDEFLKAIGGGGIKENGKTGSGGFDDSELPDAKEAKNLENFYKKMVTAVKEYQNTLESLVAGNYVETYSRQSKKALAEMDKTYRQIKNFEDVNKTLLDKYKNNPQIKPLINELNGIFAEIKVQSLEKYDQAIRDIQREMQIHTLKMSNDLLDSSKSVVEARLGKEGGIESSIFNLKRLKVAAEMAKQQLIVDFEGIAKKASDLRGKTNVQKVIDDRIALIKNRQHLEGQNVYNDYLIERTSLKGDYLKGKYDEKGSAGAARNETERLVALDEYTSQRDYINKQQSEMSESDFQNAMAGLSEKYKAEAAYYARLDNMDMVYQENKLQRAITNNDEINRETKRFWEEELQTTLQGIDNIYKQRQIEYENEKLGKQQQYYDLNQMYYENAQGEIQRDNQRWSELSNRIGKDNADEIQMEWEKYQAEKAAFDNYTVDMMGSQEAYDAKKIELEQKEASIKQKTNDAIIESDKARLQAAQTVMGGIVGLMEELGKENEDMAKLAKVVALANIAISTGEAIANTVREATKGIIYPANIPIIAGGIDTIMSNIATAIATVKSAKFAQGAVNIGGPGTETSDSIPARISRGESVMNAKATKMFEPLLIAMNAIGNGVALPRNTQVVAPDQMSDLRDAMIAANREIRPVVDVQEITRTQNRVEAIENLNTI